MLSQLKNFDFPKSVQCLVFIAQRISEEPISKSTAISIVRIADLIHLSKYGRLITNATYKGNLIQSGAIELLNILELNQKFETTKLTYIEKYLITIPKYKNFTITGKSDINEFSDSDIECLNIAIEKYSKNITLLADQVY